MKRFFAKKNLLGLSKALKAMSGQVPAEVVGVLGLIFMMDFKRAAASPAPARQPATRLAA